MQIYLPVAEMAVPAEAILLLGGFVGFLSGVFGVGGGFLATPFLIFMGLPPAIAVGTQANQLVASSLTGMLGHLRRGNVDVKMGGVMLAGGVPGAIMGVLLFRLLQHIGQIDIAISLLYILLLGSMGGLMLVESLRAIMLKKSGNESERSRLYRHPLLAGLPYRMRFPRSRVYVSILVPAGIGFAGGILASVLGIGGGFLLVPAMIYILGMPTLLAVGTSLLQIMVATAFATVLHATANHTVDLILAALMIAGGVIGAQIGVRAARRIGGVHARAMLAVIMLVVCVEMAGNLVIKPTEMYVTEVR